MSDFPTKKKKKKDLTDLTNLVGSILLIAALSLLITYTFPYLQTYQKKAREDKRRYQSELLDWKNQQKKVK